MRKYKKSIETITNSQYELKKYHSPDFNNPDILNYQFFSKKIILRGINYNIWKKNL